MFKELFEGKVTVSSVKKAIKSADLKVLYPEAFNVEKRNTDAGMGGYDYIIIAARNLRDKDQGDVDVIVKLLQSSFKNVKVYDKHDYFTATIQI
ncbi:MAG: hypothetical protein J7L15_04485 [Clostridiales bacterium]|nr:hypothetical protein [Clostridiales bacterium]